MPPAPRSLAHRPDRPAGRTPAVWSALTPRATRPAAGRPGTPTPRRRAAPATERPAPSPLPAPDRTRPPCEQSRDRRATRCLAAPGSRRAHRSADGRGSPLHCARTRRGEVRRIAAMAADVLAGLIAELPEGTVVTDPAITEGYRQDRALDPSAGKPVAVVRPRRTEEVQTVLRWATANHIPGV